MTVLVNDRGSIYFDTEDGHKIYTLTDHGEFIGLACDAPYLDPDVKLEFLTLIEMHRAQDRSRRSDAFLNKMAAVYAELYDEWPWDDLEGDIRANFIRINMEAIDGIEDAKLEYVAAVDALSTKVWVGVAFDDKVERVFKDFIKFYEQLFGEDPWEGNHYYHLSHPSSRIRTPRVLGTTTLPATGSIGDVPITITDFDMGPVTVTPPVGTSRWDTSSWGTTSTTSTVWEGTAPLGQITYTPVSMSGREGFRPGSKFKLMGARTNQLGTMIKPPHPSSTFAAQAHNARRKGRM